MTRAEREVTREILIGARWLIREPRYWMKKNYHDPNAERWCAIGALGGIMELFRWPIGHHEHSYALEVLKQEVGSIIDWNDAPGRTHAEVLALFDRVIARLAP